MKGKRKRKENERNLKKDGKWKKGKGRERNIIIKIIII